MSKIPMKRPEKRKDSMSGMSRDRSSKKLVSSAESKRDSSKKDDNLYITSKLTCTKGFKP